jgi:hypothetical protein
MKNKHLLSKQISRFMVAACAFGLASFAGLARAAQEQEGLVQAQALEQSESEYVNPEQQTLFGQLAQEFAQEYTAYKNGGLIPKGVTLAATTFWLHSNKKAIIRAAAIAGNSKSSDLSLALAEEFVTELDPLIKDGPMRKKLDAAKAYFWLREHKHEFTSVVMGESGEFPDEFAQELVTVLSPLAPKEVLEQNLNHAKKAFWVRKHKNSLIGAAVAGSVIGLAAAFGAGYYMGSGNTAKAA